jgi:hypothetical protein
MGTVFRKIVTKPLPAGAEIFTRKGQRYARWRDAKGKTRTARLTLGRDRAERLTLESSTYYAKYRDGGRLVRVVATGCRDETAARSVLAELERRAELVKAKVMTAGEDAISRHRDLPMESHLRAYFESMRGRGLSASHRTETERHLRRVVNECEIDALGDIDAGRFERWLVALVDAGAGSRTRNRYRDDLVTFANWCKESGRLLSNPFTGIGKLDEKTDRRRQRRAMTEPELVKLLDVASR